MREPFRNFRLAKLQHPNIARLLDGGTATDNHPYLVMEYVQGEPINSYCQARQLAVSAALKLFCSVCDAVQHAHQSLIVHRDLKPSNILVTGDAVPKLLDFGIAKLLQPTPLSIDTPITITGSAPMTPEFAAPEQVSGGSITTSTDVYALGVVLYELLSGQGPYAFGSGDFATMVRDICETEVPPPSRVASQSVRAQLRGDLDNIVLRALRKEAQHRYPSVRQLAEDLERYLTGQPVSASKSTLRYRASKFIKRHTLPVSLAGLSLSVLLIGIATTIWQWQSARAEHQRAERRFDEVRELTNTIVFELPGVIEKFPNSTALRKRLLDRGLAYLDRLVQERRDDPGLLRELATAYYKLATVQGNPMQPNLGDPVGALASYRKSLTLHERLLAQMPTATNLAIEVSDTYRFMSGVYGFMAEMDQARELANRCAAVLAPHLGGKRRVVLNRLIACHLVAAHWDNAVGDYDSARRRLHQALAESPRQTNTGEEKRQLSRIYEELAATVAGSGDVTGALRYERKRLALVLSESGGGNQSRRLADAYHAFAARLTTAGQTNEALGAYDQALRSWQTWAKSDSNDVRPSQALAGIYAELGSLHADLLEVTDNPTEQAKHLRQACDCFRNSKTNLQRLPGPAVGFGSRYPWLLSAEEMLQRASVLCLT